MEAAFRTITFSEPARATTNLKLVEQRLPKELWPALPTLLEQLPDPDGALNYLERYLRPETAAETSRVSAYLACNPAALHYLLVVFSHSRFLSETLIQQPELIAWLHRPSSRHGLERLKSTEDLHEEFARFQATAFEEPPAVVLARFKRREYLRIMLRDVLGIATLTEITFELSRLADVLIDRARRICEQKLQNAYGAPRFADASGRLQMGQLAILSLGKLGAQELNYSSDIDLIFLYAREGETSGGASGSISNAEYFVRLAQAIVKLLTEVTPEGSVFRVDLRLRPQGSEGDLAVSLPAALDYYRTRAREWEFQMLIKARCSSGDVETARYFLSEVRPLIYRPQFNLAAVAAVLNAREEITRELRSRSAGRAGRRPAGHAAASNVKLSPGGIRDIEFLAQCLQRLYGGADAWLASPSTLVSLQRLHDKGYLTSADFARLGTAYEFLRKVEHRLQLRDGLQRHTLPESPNGMDRLARRCGLEPHGGRAPGQELLRGIAHHFGAVREIYDRILRPSLQGRAATTLEARAVPAGSARAGEGALMRRLREDWPAVARALSQVSATGDSYSRRGAHRLISSAILDPALMPQLEAHPEWLLRAADLFSRSDLVADTLARHPDEVRVLADPGLAAFHGPLAVAAGTFEQAMAALRIAYRRGLLATVVRGLLPRSEATEQPFATFDTLTRLAGEALACAIQLAAADLLGEVDLATAPFAVIALGRLGTYEMDVGSDADLVFVADEHISAEERDEWRRLAERFVHVVSSHTREGLLLPVDTRLRPRGAEGEMVHSVAYLRDYFRGEAQGWEAATYLKARPVAANLDLGARAIAQVRSALAQRFGSNPAAANDLARQLAHTRQRLEKEGTGARAKGEFKKISGGYYDVEYLLSYFLLTGSPSGAPPANALRVIDALEARDILDTAGARTLRASAILYRSLDHALRLVTGHPANRLPEPALAERVALLLRQWGVPIEGDLGSSVAKARRETRALYESVILAAASPV